MELDLVVAIRAEEPDLDRIAEAAARALDVQASGARETLEVLEAAGILAVGDIDAVSIMSAAEMLTVAAEQIRAR